jgi:nicotinate-nucleotide adenylyltransferase
MTGRTGLLGGTFDPPHNAHLVMAHTAREALALDRVLLAPATLPPHKETAHSDWTHRLAMSEAAAAVAEGVEASRIEDEGAGPSYTADLLRRARGRYGGDLYFIMGADSLREFPSWREPGRILELSTVVVFPREGLPMHCQVPGDASLVLFEAPVMDVSSTEVRERIQARTDWGSLVPDAVAAYIRRHRLYGL